MNDDTVYEPEPEVLADADLANRYHFMRERYTIEEVMAWYIESQQRIFTRIATAWQADILNAINVRDSIGSKVG